MDSYTRVRRFLSETLGVDEDEIHPESRLAENWESFFQAATVRDLAEYVERGRLPD